MRPAGKRPGRRGSRANAPWIETFASVAAILFAFFVLLATLRFAPEAAAGAAAPPKPLAARDPAGADSLPRELRARLGDRADLLDLYATAGAAGCRIRLDGACDFAPGSDAIEFVASRLLDDLGGLLVERGARVTVHAAEEPGESAEGSGRLASRRALAVAARLAARGVPAADVEARAATRERRGGAIEIEVTGEGAREAAR